MRLRELEPEFIKLSDERGSFRRVDSIAEADGLMFVCPECMRQNELRRPGCHSVICWSPKVPLTIEPGPGRWSLIGTSIDDLTLVASSSSVLLQGPGCKAHFHITAGAIAFCADSGMGGTYTGRK